MTVTARQEDLGLVLREFPYVNARLELGTAEVVPHSDGKGVRLVCSYPRMAMAAIDLAADHLRLETGEAVGYCLVWFEDDAP